MIEGLYHLFNDWSYDGQIWLYSDPHFSDQDMKDYFNYPSDEEQIKRINSKVGKDDTIIILGDVGNVEAVKKIKGYKVLLTGNHDLGKSKYERIERFYKVEEVPEELKNSCRKRSISSEEFYYYDNGLFDEVFSGPLFISDKILLSHEPIDLPFVFNIHGHDHSNFYKFSDESKHLNVSANLINYTPVSLRSIIKSGVLKNIDSIHRMTIDNATERKKEKE